MDKSDEGWARLVKTGSCYCHHQDLHPQTPDMFVPRGLGCSHTVIAIKSGQVVSLPYKKCMEAPMLLIGR